MRTVVLYARSPDWRAVVERADELMASPEFRVLKSEARTRAGFLDLPGAGPAFIKRVEVSSWSRGVYARVRGSRAARSLAGAAMLEARGFAHPEPLAAMDLYQAGAIRASYLVSRALVNADCSTGFCSAPAKSRDATCIAASKSPTPSPRKSAACTSPGSTRATCRRPTSWSNKMIRA